MASLDYYDVTAPLSRPDLPDAPSVAKRVTELEKAMRAAAKELDFEHAAEIRDELRTLRELQIFRS
jgi:excinuclease UvrABC helicase subunit UvrB